MSNFMIAAELREELGKNANRRLRQQGKIPAVVYGRGAEAVSLTVDPKEILNILQSDSGQNTIVDLRFGERSQNALIRDFQTDPVRGHLLHADFQTIAMDEIMEFEVPVEVIGTAAGVKLGGILDNTLREIEVECLPSEVPDHFVVDVSDLQIGDVIHVSEIAVDSSKVKILEDPEQIVVHVLPPTVIAEEEVEEEEEIEPELIKKGKEEEVPETEEEESS